MYDLRSVVDVDAFAAVEPGTNILVSGPAMVGKDDLLFSLLADGAAAGEGVVVVTTNDDAAGVVAAIEDRAPEAASHWLCAVDCRGEGGRTAGETESGAYLQHVGGPGDMTGMGVSITDCFERLQHGGVDRGRFGLTSLSTVLTYTDREAVFKFCHVLASRLDAAEFLGAFTIDASAHDEQTLQVIKQAFDGLIEVRERDGRREAQVRGVGSGPSEWVVLAG